MRRREATSSPTDPRDVDFLSYVPRLSPHLVAPTWLAPLADVLRRMFLASAGLGPPVRALVSVPPQHGKTSLIQHSLVGWLEHRPQDALVYATYNRGLAREKSREMRDLARLADVPLRADSRSLDTWTTQRDGGMRARALVGGALTGTPGLRAIVVDDPYKGRREAESAATRRDVQQSFSGNIVSRLHTTTSILVNHTRWHEDDLIGWLDKTQPDAWEYHNLEAINDAGEALWQQGQPLSLLEEKRRMGGEYDWWSLYMGQPRPREGKLFQGVVYFDTMPEHRRIAIGVDLAYSEKSSSDWSVAVVMAESYGRWYVLDVVRRQCSAPAFAEELRKLASTYPGAPMRFYGAAAERGGAELMARFGVPLQWMLATTDKYLRAQPLSAAWNRGAVAVRDAAWTGQFTSTLLEFTGLGDACDDDVDAAAAAFDMLPAIQGEMVSVPERVVEKRPRRDPAFVTRGRGRLGSW